MKRLLLFCGMLLTVLQPLRTQASVTVYVGYFETKTHAVFLPNPFWGSNTLFFGKGLTPNDTGAILIRNTGDTVVTLGAGCYVDGFANGTKFQLWDSFLGSGLKLNPGLAVILAGTAAGNFVTSDQPAISNPSQQSNAIPQVHLMLDGTMQVFADTAQVLNTGGIDTELAYGRNKSLQWRPIGTTGILYPGGTGLGTYNVLTQRYDNNRSSLNPQEVGLTPANVSATTFGKLFTYPVDGQIYAQPVICTHVAVSTGSYHNLVYVATEHNSVYAFDADSNAGANSAPIWHVNLGPSASVGCGDLTPEIGITSTPVIDTAQGAIFVVTKGYQNNQYVLKLHSLALATGQEKLGSPVVLNATVPGVGDGGTTVSYQSQYVHQRTALLETNGVLYIASASHCDITPYHGWVLGYDPRTLKQLAVFNTTPDGGLGGIWMGGAGLGADTSGNIFFSTGNGTFDANTTNRNYGDSVMKLSTQNGFTVKTYFTPYNQADLSNNDTDLGSGGVMLLPDAVGSTAHPHLIIAAGKQSVIYLLDRDNMGGYNSTTQDNHQIVQEIDGQLGFTIASPAYFNGRIYYNSTGDVMKAFSIQNAQMSTTPVSQSNVSLGFPGATPLISANGTSTPIAWAIENNNSVAVLHAFDANNLSTELYNSANQSGRDQLDGYVKFNNPVVANAKVYVPTADGLSVFGGGYWASTPTISPSGGSSTTSIKVTLSSTMPGATLYYTTDGSTPTTNSSVYSVPFTITSSAVVQAIAVVKNFLPSSAASASYFIGDPPGNGDGLLGSYFNNMNLSGVATVQEVDPTINFNWNGNPPVAGVPGTQWSARWTGYVLPQSTGVYTFTTNSDDGTQLWVNGQEIINDWSDHAPTYDSGTISLVRGTKVKIILEYYQDGGGSLMQLLWSTLGVPQQIIPQSQLFSH